MLDSDWDFSGSGSGDLPAPISRLFHEPDDPFLVVPSHQAILRDLNAEVRRLGEVSKTMRRFMDRAESTRSRPMQLQLARWESGFRQAPIALFLTSEDGEIVAANAAAARLTGYGQEALVGHCIEPLLFPRPSRDLAEQLHEVKNSTAPVERNESRFCRSSLTTGSGAEIPVEICVNRLHDRLLGLVGYRWLMRDRRDEDRHDEERQQLLALVENSTDFIAMAKLDGTVFYINDAGRALLGLEGMEAVTRTTILDYFPDDVKPLITGTVLPLLHSMGRWQGEVSFRHFKTNQRIEMHYSAFVVPHPSTGEAMCLATVSRDMTSRNASQKREGEHEQLLAHASRLSMLGEMSAGFAHELNQPLCAIVADASAALTTLSSQPGTAPEALDALRSVVEQGQRAGEIIRRIRNFAQKREPLWTNTRLPELLRDAVGLMKPEAKTFGISIQIEVAEDLPVVLVDAVQIEQVLVNLMRNALAAMADTTPAERRLIVRATCNESDEYTISVEDSGLGLSTEMMGRIFEKFFSTKRGDLGLGLSISRSFVEAHGGKLWVECNPERGVTFFFTIPTGPTGASHG